MQKLNAVAAFAVAFVLTVFAVTFWLQDGAPSRTADNEAGRVSIPLVNSAEPAALNRRVLRGG